MTIDIILGNAVTVLKFCMVREFLTCYGPTDGRYLSCSEASVRTVSLSPCSSHYTYKALPIVKIVSFSSTFRRMDFACKASSNGFTRNPDFSSQTDHVFTQSNNKKNEETDDSDSLEESELFPSKNGPSLSVTDAPKSIVDETPPEPREMDELSKFCEHVMARLGLMSDAKGKKKPWRRKEVQGHGHLDRRVRKYVNPLGKTCSSKGSSRDDFLHQLKEDGIFNGLEDTRKHVATLGTNSKNVLLEAIELNGSFDQEKSSNSPKLARERITAMGKKNSSSRGRNNIDFGDKSEQDGLLDKEKSTTLDSHRVVEQEFLFVNLLNNHYTQNGAFSEEKNTTSFDTNDGEKLESPPISRPVSKFRRRSPIPRSKFELIGSSSVTDSNLDGKRESTLLDHEKRKESSDFEKGYIDNRVEKEKPTVDDDLRTMKVPELRALAKSRGMKGFSKLKKQQLLELLSGNSA